MPNDLRRRMDSARSVLLGTTPEILPPEEGFRAVATPALRAELADALAVTAENLARLAAIWAELERRGEDLSALRSGIAVYLPMIASGRLDARLVVRYAGQTMLLRHLAEVPVQDQARIVADDTVTVVDYDGEDFVEKSVPLISLGSRMIGQVISGGRIVPAEEQRTAAVSRARRSKPAPATKVERIARDRTGDPGGGRTQMAVEINEREHEALKRKAKAAGVSMARLVRSALVAAKLLD